MSRIAEIASAFFTAGFVVILLLGFASAPRSVLADEPLTCTGEGANPICMKPYGCDAGVNCDYESGCNFYCYPPIYPYDCDCLPGGD